MTLPEKNNPSKEDGHHEITFSFDEVFFSRTDSRGIILAGNTVFQRVSMYDWDALINKPHNIIRHPDMPKGVFYTFWSFLKQGKTVGAYVKNRAKDGRYYWVFAITAPCEGGFLSARLKPSSHLFEKIKHEYSALLLSEQNNKLSPEASSQLLLNNLKKLGFQSYDEFMSVAINKELLACGRKLGQKDDNVLVAFETLVELGKSMTEETARVFVSYEENKYVPLNLQVLSAQLGDLGNSIGVVSSNYKIVSTEIKNEIEQFSNSAMQVFHKISEGQFQVCTGKLQQRVVDFFQKEIDSENDQQHAEEMESVRIQARKSQDVRVSIQKIISQIEQFQEDCQKMKMFASSLEVIRVMGKVEAANLPGLNEGLNELTNDLKVFQVSISESLGRLIQTGKDMIHLAKIINKALIKI